MKLADLAQKPQLTKLTISNPELVEKYGDELEFYMYDRQPLDVFSKMANASTDDLDTYFSLLTQIILKEDGTPVMSDDHVLPVDVMTEAMKLIGENLGK
jgi:hypothetical protein